MTKNCNHNFIELLAPAGNMEKLKTVLHFGADAVYLSGKDFSLRALSDNFTLDELKDAVDFVHSQGKKLYVTVNIFARNQDFSALKDYLQYLRQINVDAVIVSDLGVLAFIKKHAPTLKIHISTQANITNKYAVEYCADFAERVVLARELPLKEIAEIHDYVPQIRLEAFVHGAMCISYSGRCLISSYLTGRDGNRGECVQSCRWEYSLTEKSRGESFDIAEDARGSYILNSKDLRMIEHIDKLIAAGITSFKIEGRMKSAYYAAGTVSAYRRALSAYYKNPENYVCPKDALEDLEKISHRSYCTGFYLGKPEQYYLASKAEQSYDFVGVVKEETANGCIVEQRNRFKTGDILEVLSPNDYTGKTIKIENMSANGEIITDALIVQQQILLQKINLKAGDILHRRRI